MGSHTCTPCPERLPSCVGLPDGRHSYPGRMWQSYFIVCYKHRTTVERCVKGIFNPVTLQCDIAIPTATAPTTVRPDGKNI